MGVDHAVLRLSRERCSCNDIRRQDDLDATLLGLGEIALDHVNLIRLEQALADLVALRREEGEHHATTDQQAVGGLQQVGDDSPVSYTHLTLPTIYSV